MAPPLDPPSLIPQIPLGAVSPQSLLVNVVRADAPGVSLMDVTGGEFHVLRPDGVQLVWSPIVVELGSQTVDAVAVFYRFLAGDLSMLGRHKVTAKLTVASGSLLTVAREFLVVDEFGRSG